MMYAVLIDVLQDFLCGWLDNTKIQRSMLHEACCSERPKKSARRCSTQYWTACADSELRTSRPGPISRCVVDGGVLVKSFRREILIILSYFVERGNPCCQERFTLADLTLFR